MACHPHFAFFSLHLAPYFQANLLTLTQLCHLIGDVTEMMITWVTFAADVDSIVEYGLADKALAMTTSGSATKFVDGGSEKTVRYIHRVKLTGLQPATSYGMLYC